MPSSAESLGKGGDIPLRPAQLLRESDNQHPSNLGSVSGERQLSQRQTLTRSQYMARHSPGPPTGCLWCWSSQYRSPVKRSVRSPHLGETLRSHTSGKKTVAPLTPVWSQPWTAAPMEHVAMVRYSLHGNLHLWCSSVCSAAFSPSVRASFPVMVGVAWSGL